MKEQMFEIMQRILVHDFLRDKIVLVFLGAVLFVIAGILLNKKGWYLIHLAFIMAGTVALSIAYRNAKQEAYDQGRSEAFKIQKAWHSKNENI